MCILFRPSHSPSKISPAARVAQSMMIRNSLSNSTNNRETSPTKAGSPIKAFPLANSNKSSRESSTKVYSRVVSQSPRGSHVSADGHEGSPGPGSSGSLSSGSPKPTRSGSIVIELSEQVMKEKQMIVWCMWPHSMSWVSSSATRYKI